MKTLDELNWRDCRFPEGDFGGGEFLFCGESSLPGKSWCARHAAIVYKPKRPKARASVDLELVARFAGKPAARAPEVEREVDAEFALIG